MSKNNYYEQAKEYKFLADNTKEPTLSDYYYSLYIECLFKGDLKEGRDTKRFGRHKENE